MDSDLSDFRTLFDDMQDQRRRTASEFNVLEAFGVSHQELPHSNFLAYLLDPSKPHDQGPVFLTSLLKSLRLEFLLTSVQGARVRTEAELDHYGRVDILIRLANGQLILIENKVLAKEGRCQIGGYQKWLKRQGGPADWPHQIVFLTPEGRQPVSTSKPEEVVCLSYARLADWIGSCLEQVEAVRLRVTLEQFAGNCRQIAGLTRGDAMPGEVRQFFLDPERLGTALAMAKHLTVFKMWLHERFWKEVETMLTDRLNANGYNQSWKVRFDDNLFGEFNFKGWSGWQIAWRNRQDQPSFAVRVEFWSGGNKGMFFGISRGAYIYEASQVPRDTAICNRLEGMNFATRTSHWWPGLRFFRDCDLPQFDLSLEDDVLDLCREMQNNDRPLTNRVVDLTWDLFCEFRQGLEDLNQDYPYDTPEAANA